MSYTRDEEKDLIYNEKTGQYRSANQYFSKFSDGTNTYIVKDAEARSSLANKQDTLVSGTNIKTINNNSLLGSGNITLDSLPSQSGNSGKFLTTNGSAASWTTVSIPTVDQTYNASSANAQSGAAIAGAGFLKNTATGTNSITILGTSASNESSVNIGQGSSVKTFDVAIGRGATATNGGNCVSVGFFASSTSQSISIGASSKSQALRSIAIGTSAKTEANYAIQLGYGTNSEANSFYVATSDSNNYKLLGSDGKIPDDRLNTTIARTSQIPTTTSQLTNNSGFITGISWGDITGTLSSQSDLNTALNNKANDSSVVHLSGDETINGGKIFNQAFIIGTTETHPNEGGQLIFKKSHNSTMAGDVIVDQNVNNLRVIGQSTSLGIIVPFYIDCENNKVYTATPASGDNSTQVATTAFVKAQGYATTSQIPTIDQTYNASSSNAQSGTAVASAISSAISSVYKPAGSVVFANLPTPSASNEGNVYNVTNAFTTTSNFVEGAGINYPAGTNVVIINTGSNTYKFDTLTGAFQPLLVSGTNIKTINNTSILGSGNISITGLPSQTSQSGKFLTTDGTDASWATVTQPSIATTSTAGLVKPDGTTITITNDGTISVPEAVFIKNENTTPSTGLTIQGSTKNLAGINIGLSSVITAATAIAIGKSSNAGSNAVALGNLSAATGTCSVALGTNAKATTEYTISIGCFSTNYTTTRYTLNFGFGGNYTYTLLDGLTGLIPDARLSTNIARTSALPTTATTSTTGLVKPDGTTITITNDGTISASAGAYAMVIVDYTEEDE